MKSRPLLLTLFDILGNFHDLWGVSIICFEHILVVHSFIFCHNPFIISSWKFFPSHLFGLVISYRSSSVYSFYASSTSSAAIAINHKIMECNIGLTWGMWRGQNEFSLGLTWYIVAVSGIVMIWEGKWKEKENRKYLLWSLPCDTYIIAYYLYCINRKCSIFAKFLLLILTTLMYTFFNAFLSVFSFFYFSSLFKVCFEVISFHL